MSRKILIAILIIALVGDYFADPQSASLNELSIVNLMVIDYENEELVVDFVSSYKESDSNLASFKNVRTSGQTITECINKAENKLGMKIFLGHLKTVFLKESFLESPDNYEKFIDFTERNSRFNHFVSIFVLDDENDLFKSKIEEDDKATNEFLNTVVLKYPPKEMLVVEYVDITNDFDTFALPRLQFADEQLEYYGISVIKNKVLSNTYNETDEALYKLLVDKSEAVFFDTEYCSLSVRKSVADLTHNGDLNFDYEINIFCEIKELRNMELSAENGDEEVLEKELEKFFDTKLKIFTDKLQRNDDDVINLILHLYKYDHKEYLELYAKYDNLFQNSNINVDTKVHIIRNEMNK